MTRNLRVIDKLLIALVLGCSVPAPAQATDDDLGIWAIFSTGDTFGSANAPGPWRYSFDAQLRYFDIGTGINQYQLRPGIGYDVSDNMSVQAGYLYGHARTRSSDTVIEHRLWQQLGWNVARWDRGTLSMRARLEQRAISRGDDIGWRLRYMLKYLRPLGKTQSTQFIFSVEPFFALRDTDWGGESGFRQDRTAIGIEWAQSQKLAIENGYMYQYVRVADAENRVDHLAIVNFKVKF